MRLSMDHMPHPSGNLQYGVHVCEVAGVKFATSVAQTRNSVNSVHPVFHTDRIASEFYVSGVRPLDWHDGKTYIVATVELAERRHLNLYDHDGWELPNDRSDPDKDKRCWVPSLGGYLQAEKKSRFINMVRGVKKPGTIWVGRNASGTLYFAGLHNIEDLRIRKTAVERR